MQPFRSTRVLRFHVFSRYKLWLLEDFPLKSHPGFLWEAGWWFLAVHMALASIPGEAANSHGQRRSRDPDGTNSSKDMWREHLKDNSIQCSCGTRFSLVSRSFTMRRSTVADSCQMFGFSFRCFSHRLSGGCQISSHFSERNHTEGTTPAIKIQSLASVDQWIIRSMS